MPQISNRSPVLEGKVPSGAGSFAALDQPLPLLLVVGSFLAITTVFAKAAPGLGWHPLALLQWSVFGGAILLYVVGRRRAVSETAKQGRRFQSWLKGPQPAYLTITGSLFIAPNMIAVTAAPHVGAGFVSLCYAFPLVLTYALAVPMGLDRLQVLRVLGVVFGGLGAVLLALSGKELSPTASFWSLAALMIPLFLAIGNIYRSLKWPEGARPVDLAVGMMAIGCAVLATFNGLTGIPMMPFEWTKGATALLVAQIAIFALQYELYFRLQKSAGPVYLSQIGSVAAVIGLGLGYVIFNEIPSPIKLAAVGSVALGILCVTLGRRTN